MLARCSATPVLKPIMTVSEMKFTRLPAPQSQATKASAADEERGGRGQRGVARRVAPARAPSEVPTSSEIAEVTVTAVCRELQKSQKTRPANRQA